MKKNINKTLMITINFSMLLVSTNMFAQTETPDKFDVLWHNGYQINRDDGQFKMKFGGRIMYDLAFFIQDDSLESIFGSLNNGAEFRRARFFNSGLIYNNIKYKIQFDFADGKVSFKDVYIMITKIPAVGNLKIGHFKEPFRLEALTSSKYITFMERGFPMAMSTERNMGFMLQNSFWDSKLAYQIGIFRSADNYGNDKQANNGYAITSRLSGLPINNSGKKQLLHLGVAYSYRKPETKEYKIKSKPESHLGKDYISTDMISDVDVVTHLGTEAAFVLGSFSIQGELVQSSINTSTDTSYSFTGVYGQVSYFLTGEHRKYKDYKDGFGRVSPEHNFGNGEGGSGAWEIAVRYSNLNLDNGAIQGGQLGDITVGLNWYLNPATRIMTNYVLAQLNGIGNTSIIQMRFQIDF